MKNKKCIIKKLKNLLPTVMLSGVLILTFQNCANEDLMFQDDFASKALDYFNFNYKSAAEAYWDIQVLADTTPDDTYQKYVIVGGISSSEALTTDQVSWEVSILNSSGTAVCPVIMGNSATNGTLVEGECVMTKNLSPAQIVANIIINGKTIVYEKQLQP